MAVETGGPGPLQGQHVRELSTLHASEAFGHASGASVGSFLAVFLGTKRGSVG
jgi:hypothetical protein